MLALIMAGAGSVTLKIEKLAAGGDGLAFYGGRAVFVPFALPGETVLAVIKEEKKDFSLAALVTILEPSPNRVEPACPIYGECGGCGLQHLAYPCQLEEKTSLVRESLKRIGHIELDEIAAVPSLPFSYRNRVQFHFTPEGRIGFMKRGSSQVVEARSCPVAVKAIRSWMEERSGGTRGFEELKNYVVGKDRFIAFGAGNEVYVEGRNGVIEVTLLGKRISFHIRGFFQSNLYLLEYFIPDVVADLSGRAVADLYGGVGLFSAFLGSAFEKTVCVENDPFSIELAKRNAPNSVNEFYPISVEDWIKGSSARRHYDAILVDPPRTGLSPSVRAWLAQKRAPVIVYVSCDHATLARDAADLKKAGYRLESLKVFDFFPQTGHAECHARFRLG